MEGRLSITVRETAHSKVVVLLFEALNVDVGCNTEPFEALVAEDQKWVFVVKRHEVKSLDHFDCCAINFGKRMAHREFVGSFVEWSKRFQERCVCRPHEVKTSLASSPGGGWFEDDTLTLLSCCLAS